MVEITMTKNMIIGLNDETKPTTNIPDGTTCMTFNEVTQKLDKTYMFYNGTWYEL